ncbi:response regulator [Nostoc flagelliforme FACHB-838]|uniref:Response regulator n=1 Tax=Nostoc flagelliforme FACHB-838 TaxID=2692904 RepID=A0ABR8E7E2_9NOSO|nr:response regulator [Nostoc flagelliforme]MBD2536504.1 response regulator [Nostoc flagelliforme FACHB-838]
MEKTAISNANTTNKNDTKRILVCDDVADNSFLIRTILEAENCLVKSVDSGAAVLTFLETDPNPPDLLILDIQMPIMDGFEVVQRLRELTKFPFLPILLVTSFDYDLNKMNGIKCDEFIQKPIDIDTVTSKVREILDRNY